VFELEDTTERFYVAVTGPDHAAVSEGFRWLIGYAHDHDHDRAALVAPGLQNVERMGGALGPDVATALRKNRSAVIEGVTVELHTQRKLPYSFDEGPVLAVWTHDRDLDKLDELGSPALCAVPWIPDNITGWLENWNPTDLRSRQTAGEDDTDLNPVVAAALEELTAWVNVGTGLSNQSDRASAIQMFRICVTPASTTSPLRSAPRLSTRAGRPPTPASSRTWRGGFRTGARSALVGSACGGMTRSRAGARPRANGRREQGRDASPAEVRQGLSYFTRWRGGLRCRGPSPG
jgi:hypothetical protein